MKLRRVLRSDALPAHGTRGRGWTVGDASSDDEPLLRRVRLGDAHVLLARLATGEVVAFDQQCPHQGTSLEHATLFHGHVRCPRHNYVYDPRSGRNVLPTQDTTRAALPRLAPHYLPTYAVEERDGWIWVSDVANPPPADYDPQLGGTPPPERPERQTAPAVDEPREHPPERVRATVGTDFELTLPTRPRPSHLWKVDLGGDHLVMLGQSYDAGATCTYRLRLAARSAGTATVRCAYGQPWSDEPAEVRTFTVEVQPS